jgi:hypothetical protein
MKMNRVLVFKYLMYPTFPPSPHENSHMNEPEIIVMQLTSIVNPFPKHVTRSRMFGFQFSVCVKKLKCHSPSLMFPVQRPKNSFLSFLMRRGLPFQKLHFSPKYLLRSCVGSENINQSQSQSQSQSRTRSQSRLWHLSFQFSENTRRCHVYLSSIVYIIWILYGYGNGNSY